MITWLLTILMGVTAMADMPRGEATVAAQLARLYDAAAADLAAAAAKAVRELEANPGRRSSAFGLARATRLANQLDERLAKLGIQRDRVIRTSGSEAVATALRATDAELRALVPQGVRGGAFDFNALDERPVRVVAQDTAARVAATLGELDGAVRQQAGRAVTLFRSLSESPANVIGEGGGGSAEVPVNTAIARALVSGDRTLADRAVRDLFRDPSDPTRESVRKLGGKVIQVGQREMTVRDYADVVARTRMREATVAASRERTLSAGVRLKQITGNQSTNFCTAFLGLVVSITGSDEVVDGVTYRAVERLPNGGPPFHPRCSKSLAPYDAEFSSPERRAAARQAEQTYVRRAASGSLLKDLD